MRPVLLFAAACRPGGPDADDKPTGSQPTLEDTSDTQDPNPTDTDTETTDNGTGAVGAADCSEAPVDIAARAGAVRKICLYADGTTCTIHADDPAATSCAVHTSLLNFEWNIAPPEERRLLELYGWTAVAFDQGTLVPGSGIEPDAIELTALPLGTPITVSATHDASGVTYEIAFSFGDDVLSVLSVAW